MRVSAWLVFVRLVGRFNDWLLCFLLICCLYRLGDFDLLRSGLFGLFLWLVPDHQHNSTSLGFGGLEPWSQRLNRARLVLWDGFRRDHPLQGRVDLGKFLLDR